jgi:DNA polymerase-3 subunit epsilon
MRKHNLAFIDVETTGFDPQKHEVIEIGCVVVKQKDATGTDFEIVKELELKIKPEKLEDADPGALRVNGYNDADWLFAHSLQEAMTQFAEVTKDAIFVAHNLAFDYSFIHEAFKKSGVENKMFFSKLDTISIAYAKLHKDLSVERFSLQKLTEHFGIINQRAHTALADARATLEVYEKLMNL